MNRMRIVAVLAIVSMTFSDVAFAVGLPPRPATLMPTHQAEPAKAPPLEQSIAGLPLSFEENRGQSDPAVKFLARGRGYTAFITATETVLVVGGAKPIPRRDPMARLRAAETARPEPASVVRMSLVGGNTAPRVEGHAPLPGIVNYFIGKDPAKWRTNIPTYAKVETADVYPGIAMVYYGHGRSLEYDFVVAPGADPGRIRLAFEGPDSIRVDGAGDLVLATAGGELRMHKPAVYQTLGATRQTVAGRYELVTTSGATHVTFALGSYDRSRPLVIDPTYSTLLGGSGEDAIFGIAADSSGAAYVTGNTNSADFPLVGALQTDPSTQNVFVAKLDPTGHSLVYSTVLGGSGFSFGSGIAVDGSGAAYIAGFTNAKDFPTTGGAFEPIPVYGAATFDSFVTKLAPSGVALVYSTFLGGSNGSQAYGIAVTAQGNAVVTGTTYSPDFPMLNAFQGVFGGGSGGDAFVTKLLPDGSDLAWSTYLGGSGDDQGQGIAVDSAGLVYVAGYTRSMDFPLLNPLPGLSAPGSKNQFYSGFVTKLDGNGVPIYSTYLGGTRAFDNSGRSIPPKTIAQAVAADANGYAYVTGQTCDSDFPSNQGGETLNGACDAFVTVMGAAGLGFRYSRYLGMTSSGTSSTPATDASGTGIVSLYGGNTVIVGYIVGYPIVLGNRGPSTLANAFMVTASEALNLLHTSATLGNANLSTRSIFTYAHSVALAPGTPGRLYVGGDTDDPTVIPSMPLAGGYDGFVVTLRAKADLEFTDFNGLPSVGVSTAAPGAKLTATVSVKNKGGNVAGTSITKLYMHPASGSDQGTLSPLGQIPVPGLAPGASANGTLAFTLPKPTPAGSYRLRACLDAQNAVDDEFEGPVFKCGDSPTTFLVQRPDFSVASVGVARGTATATGRPITITTLVRNTGNAPTVASTLRFYVGLSSTRNAGALPDIRLPATQTVPVLAANSSVSLTTSTTVPASAPNPYFIIACADDTGLIGESNETNNCMGSGPQPGPRPDLRIGSVAVTPGAVTPASRVTIHTQVVNAGDAAASPSTVRLYLGRAPSRQAGDVALTATPTVGALRAGASVTVTTSTGVSTRAVGSYFVIACSADDHCTASGRIVVVPPIQ